MAGPLVDFTSATWQELARWAQAELDLARIRNDQPALEPAATAALRGEIAFLKKFIALPATAKRETELSAPVF